MLVSTLQQVDPPRMVLLFYEDIAQSLGANTITGSWICYNVAYKLYE